MQQQLTIKLLPSEAASESAIRDHLCKVLAVEASALTGLTFIKRSIDARGKQPTVLLTLKAFINEPYTKTPLRKPRLHNVSCSDKRVLIAGAGPAGLFAAIRLIENGIKPIVLERGKDVQSRRRDLAMLNRQGIINPESNYCFGEGGAGTYSDGKLFTRSRKRGDIERILHTLVYFGADENILSDSHPHIGTNKLPKIITGLTNQITECGGEVHFNKKIIDIHIKNNLVTGVTTTNGVLEGDALILATGHSAHDIFRLLHQKNILIQSKPFALGVRVEHPQALIDQIQYHCPARGDLLPAASYSMVHQAGERGVFSFCMCPGGIIAPASTSPGELVVNGWSPSKRNNPFANSGIVVAIEEKDFGMYTGDHGPLAALAFQHSVEVAAYRAGGGKFVAPAQRLADFTSRKFSGTLPVCSYVPGVHSAQLHEVLPPFVFNSLKAAFTGFGKKMRGYFTNEAIVLATESRTSSPVRIPRNPVTLEHPQVNRLYPCGEGAGYAGGIASAAMDGEKIAVMIAKNLKR